MKFISFYLPQFHPIPENNAWWGDGFTEWRNVVKARPRFKGHRQPQLPGSLGYYDLRLRETKVEQWELASSHGIDAFCFYHYWFNGQRLLETPIEQILADSSLSHSFCICWANENWTRAWDGLDREVLMAQRYDSEDCAKHALEIGRILSDVRYLRIGDSPMLLIYRPDLIPDPGRYLGIWREVFSKEFNLTNVHIAGCVSGLVGMAADDIINAGFDSVVDFQPNRNFFPSTTVSSTTVKTLRHLLPAEVYQWLKGEVSAIQRVDYAQLVKVLCDRDWPTKFLQFPVIFPSWDNSARRKTPTVIQNDDPNLFKAWLENGVSRVASYPQHEQVIFINAWNEWAEGCHLEPDEQMGTSFLDVVDRVKRSL